MNINKLTELSIYIISEYYKNNLTPYFSYIDDDILWFGPAIGQCICGKQSIIDAWNSESHSLTFTMNNISSRYVAINNNCYEIILTYKIFTHYPDNHTTMYNQVLHYTWAERKITDSNGNSKKCPRIFLIHISNLFDYDSRDTIYPVHLKDQANALVNCTKQSRILLKGQNHFTYSVPMCQIMWIESTDKGLHSIVHTENEDLLITKTVSSFYSEYKKTFIQIHSGYIINPLFAYNIRRFEVEMTDGNVLPIPQKKYTKVKEEFTKWLDDYNK